MIYIMIVLTVTIVAWFGFDLYFRLSDRTYFEQISFLTNAIEHQGKTYSRSCDAFREEIESYKETIKKLREEKSEVLKEDIKN